MITLFCDLDNTLIYSHKKSLNVPKRVAEMLHNKEQSYITRKTFDFLSSCREVSIVAVTARTMAQYDRVYKLLNCLHSEYALILSAPQSAKMKTAYVSAPLVGSIRCGNPEDEEGSIEEYVSLPVSMFGKGDFYILRAKGDSMVDAGIDEDDLLVIERNCPALEGDIVVALDEDNQNTLKRYAGYDKDSGYYILEYENEARYPGKTIKVRSFQVQGVARHVIKSL